MTREELTKQSKAIIASMLNGAKLNVVELGVLAQFAGLDVRDRVLTQTESVKYTSPAAGDSYTKVIIGSYDK